MWPDLINGGFELIGAYFTWRNWLQLRRDRTITGVYWPTTAFFSAWGIWNLVYYPALGQWASLVGGAVLVAGNVAWVVLAIRLRGTKKEAKAAQQRDELQGLLREFLALDDWHDDAIAPIELIERARVAVGLNA